jgi:membrane-associated protease RseP (regulator of RpoE activity)
MGDRIPQFFAPRYPQAPAQAYNAGSREPVFFAGAGAMKMIYATVFALLLGVGPSAALAQPTLDRVERQVREQTEDEAAGAPAGEPGFLGLMADDSKDNGRGLRLVRLLPDSPAAKAGLRTGDLITAVNGQALGKLDDMARVLGKLPAGTKLEFQISRADGDRIVEVTLGTRPPDAPRPPKQLSPTPRATEGQPTPAEPGPQTGQAASGRSRLGVRTLPVTEDVRRQFNLPVASGALVSSVTAGSPAEKAAIPSGAIITSLDGKKIEVPDDLAAVIKQAGPGRRLEITYLSRGQEIRSQVTLDDAPPSSSTRPSLPGRVPSLAAIPRAADNASARVEALEERIRDLEDRLQRIEALLERNSRP